MSRPIPIVTTAQLIRELETHPLENAVIALDGDGTLWSGDVGEEVFEHFVGRLWLREEALPELEAMALRFQVPRHGDASTLANAMFRAYQAGTFPEREICEMMTWCYAGWAGKEFRERVRALLASQNFGSRLQPELSPIIDWAKRRSVRTVVISASPQIAVEEAAKYWGIAGADVAGSWAALHGDLLTPRLLKPTPYGDAKPDAGRELFGDANWLASFGDNVFDLEMLKAARIAVLVRPKPRLLERANDLPNCARLAPDEPGP